ncbi:betaine-aldehyde dehydrogenase [Serratia marcescens]|uniref:betaine-aldehyde dehydrogenase n=1 Tax=Serratia marcescens TaxID=615 RepID=UPI000F7F91DD|nr:betaine-aldehyde dehydrogenase [Serratia marcescens]RTF23098.1 betaine-aldehyde dehydrogenase [Serratia marcescens]RTF38963.1 betaine-aldehyde dehydrogenase [Serratia marcescens]RTF80423.1 betaine-aldehyde dehydrogenase [Serratia marcescens]RTG16114.1 betaine-aldehyde dehydrogenase [Serratia marcescens]RTG30715.1 betaine-aldehyde dehydrogenase [Serratia marcescens]
MKTVGNFIDGQVCLSSSNQTVDVHNPASGQVERRVTQSTAAEVKQAIDVAHRAFADWSRTTPLRRARIMFNFKALLEQHRDELAELIVSEHGKVYSDALGELTRGMEVVEFACGIPHLIKGEYSPDVGGGVDSFSLMQPLGVVAGITPFNFPAMVPMWMFPIALACGNTFILKPPALVPSASVRLAELLKEAGLPDGVFNVVTGSGAEVGQYLTDHPGIAKVSFTGGVKTGKKVMANASGSTLKEVTMELGGKSPLIIFDDADLDRAADIAMMANFYSSGQVCTNGTRVFVPAALQAQFEAKILERVKRIRLGDPTDPQTNFGPLVSFAHMESVLRFIESGKNSGARLLCGGERVTHGEFGKGAYVAPTVFSDCRDDMEIVREEIFGPVMSILSYQSEEEVVRRANDTTFGLAAGVVTHDLARAHRVIHQLEAGICWINTWGESAAEMPVGGYKQSGVGRENGLTTLEHYTQIKSVQVELGDYASVF